MTLLSSVISHSVMVDISTSPDEFEASISRLRRTGMPISVSKSINMFTSANSKSSISSGNPSILWTTGSISTVTGFIFPVTDSKVRLVRVTLTEIRSFRDRVISESSGKLIVEI